VVRQDRVEVSPEVWHHLLREQPERLPFGLGGHPRPPRAEDQVVEAELVPIALYALDHLLGRAEQEPIGRQFLERGVDAVVAHAALRPPGEVSFVLVHQVGTGRLDRVLGRLGDEHLPPDGALGRLAAVLLQLGPVVLGGAFELRYRDAGIDEPGVTPGRRPANGTGSRPADPDRRAAVLDWFRVDRDVLEVEHLAVVAHVVALPERLDDVEGLVERVAPPRVIDVGNLEFGFAVARGDPEREPPTGEHVEGGRPLGEEDGVVERDQTDRRPDTYRRGHRREIGEDPEVLEIDVVDGVVFADPDRAVPERFREPRGLGHLLAVADRRAVPRMFGEEHRPKREFAPPC
jgi:hypothetical protein